MSIGKLFEKSTFLFRDHKCILHLPILAPELIIVSQKQCGMAILYRLDPSQSRLERTFLAVATTSLLLLLLCRLLHILIVLLPFGLALL